MKILHICSGFSIDYQGGITNYVRSLAKEQVTSGDEVFVLAKEGKEDGYKIIKYKTRIRSTTFYHKKDAIAFHKLKKLLLSLRPSLVHIHSMLNLDQRVWKLLVSLNIPYIVSLHDYYFICPRIQMVPFDKACCQKANTSECLTCFSFLHRFFYLRKVLELIFTKPRIENFPLRDKKIYLDWMKNTKCLLEKANLLLPVSSKVQEIFENSGIDGNYRVLNIGNNSAYNFDKIQKPDLKKEDSINLVILNNISHIKGGDLLISIIKRITNCKLKFHFFGRYSDKQKAEMESANIAVHGEYNQQNLPSLLKNMNMGIAVPIWEDNGPQIVMEMLNNKLPVFATKIGGITDFVNLTNGFLFNPFSEDDINKAVYFLNHLTYEKVNQLKKQIKPTLTPKEHALEMKKVYASIVTGDKEL